MNKAAPFEIDLEPIDKKASVGVSRGVHFWPTLKINQIILDFCPPIKDFPGPKHLDLTGKTNGRLTVIGYIGKRKRHPGRWAVRCACGKYEVRTTTSIKNPKNYGDRCQLCRHKAYLKRNDKFRRTGKNPHDWQYY